MIEYKGYTINRSFTLDNKEVWTIVVYEPLSPRNIFYSLLEAQEVIDRIKGCGDEGT